MSWDRVRFMDNQEIKSDKAEVREEKIFRRMLRDAYFNFRSFMRRNCDSFASVMVAICPFLFLYLGIDGYIKRGCFAWGGEWFLGIFWVLAIWALRSYARHVNRSTCVPIPTERFTRLDTDGSYSVEYDRIYELVLFVADYEDWLERMGYKRY